MIVANKIQSKKIGKIVKTLEFLPSFYEREFLTIDSAIKMEMLFYSVGICHQTYHLANPKLNLYGWDFLEYGFLDLMKNAPALLDSAQILKLSQQQLIEKIKPFFAQDNNPEKCTLDRLSERADLWLDMAKILQKHFDGKIEKLFGRAPEAQEAEDFYKPLRLFEAYSDPLQKKSSFFLKLVSDSRLIHLNQLKNVIPIMDYHMQRVLLRTGCVEIKDEKLKSALQLRTPISDDTAIRQACIEAMRIIADVSKMHIFKMNDVFYTLGRSCCNETMLCSHQTCEKTPCSLTRAIRLEHHDSCIFQSVCFGAKNETYRSYWQPIVNTHFY